MNLSTKEQVRISTLFSKISVLSTPLVPSLLQHYGSVLIIWTIGSYSIDFKSELTHLMFLKYLNNSPLITKRINAKEMILLRELTPKDLTALIDFSNEI